MTWLLIAALALGVFLVTAFLFKAPRSGWEAIIATIMLGLAGYALQGQPSLPSAPRDGDVLTTDTATTLIDERQALSDKQAMVDPLLIESDAFARHGDYDEAVQILDKGLKDDPKDGEAWLALANALVSHTQGALSPGALYAYKHAVALEPEAAGPPYFLGLAMASSGNPLQARSLWAGLLARTPIQAPYHAMLVSRLGQLDAYIAQMRSQGAL